ncbi:MAG: GNAT family N-acetyltransferase [Anaerolineae bacterium]|nr:GNAT family N-acetyltransferase [Anaerolineae bacterium]
MCALAADKKNNVVRPVVEKDLRLIQKLLDSAWRVHLRVSWASLQHRILSLPGVVVEDRAGLRGVMVLEPLKLNSAVMVAAALRDTWSVEPYLKTILPYVEQLVQTQLLSSLVFIGYEDWLVEALLKFGFEPREWIVMFERFGSDKPPTVVETATIRVAHRRDLAAIQTLDALAFEDLWRKPTTYFGEALALAGSFTVAELEGQIVGYEWCEIHQKRAHLTRLAIHPDYQGRGIGAQLLHRAIVDALARNINLITLNTQETNRRSRALYKRFGFVPVPQRVPVLWKDLDPPLLPQ